MATRLRAFRHLLLLLLAAVLLAPAAFAGSYNVVDVLGNIPSAQFTTYISPYSGSYRDWGNEPSIAVNPTNPDQIVISSFAFGTPGASLWVSNNAGTNWQMNFSIPTGPAPGIYVPNDQNFVYDSSGVLHGAFLSESDGNIYHGTTTDVNNPAAWSWTSGRINVGSPSGNADQPWLALNGNTVAVAYDNFGTGVEERVTLSTDGGTSFTSDNPFSAGGQVNTNVNPGSRIAMDANGNVYGVFGIGDGYNGSGVQHVTYRVNRLTSGNSNWDYTNATATPGGLAVDSGYSAQLDSFKFGGVNSLRGNTTAIGVSADGSHVYVVYGKEDASGVDRLYLAEFHDDGTGNLVERSSPVAFSIAGQRAALPSITVTANGTVVIMYDTFDGNEFHVHVATSTDGGLTFSDDDVYDFTALALTNATGGNREFGDYQWLTSMGDNIYGAFAATGSINAGSIDDTNMIAPYFLTSNVTAVPEPGSLALLGSGLAGLAGMIRRKLKR